MLEKENINKFSASELLRKSANLKRLQKVLVALAICIVLFYWYQIGYSIGKDAATGVFDKPNNSLFFLPLIAIIITVFSLDKKIKSLAEKLKK